MPYKNDKYAGVVNYTGNKQRLLKKLLPLFPPSCNKFIDACCGGMSVAMSVDYPNIVANDIESKLIDVYTVLYELGEIEAFAEITNLIDSFDLDKGNTEGYLELRDYYNQEDDDPLVLLVLMYHSFSNQIRFSDAGDFNMHFGKRTFNPSLQRKLRLFFSFLEHKQPQFSKLHYSALEPASGDFLYVDPPYLITDATYNKFWSVKEDQDLMDWLDKLPCLWGMSNVFHHKGKTNQKLIDWASNYNTHIISDVEYVSGSYHAKNTDKPTVEVYICNY